MALVFWGCLVFVVGVLVCLARRSARQKAEFWPSRRFPTFDTAELLGNFWLALFRPKAIREVDCLVYDRVKGEMGAPYAGVMLFGMPTLVVTDLEVAKRVFVKDAENFLARLQVQAMKDTDPLFANMLFFMEGEEWKNLRAKMSPTFTTGKIKRMFHVIETSSQKLVDFLSVQSEKGDVEMLSTHGRYTMAVIASAAFGIDAKTFVEEDPIFTRMAKKLNVDPNFKVMLVFLLMTLAPKVASALKIGFLDKGMGAFFTQVIMDAIKHRQATGDKRDDFLQLMLELRSGKLKDDEEKSNESNPMNVEAPAAAKTNAVDLSDEVLVAQSVLFILAGFDTTQTLLVFAVYELALNPDVQDKLRAELEESWRKSNGFNYETVNQLEYLDKVINESLRKYPPLTRLERRTMADYPIPETDLVLPKGTQVVIPTFAIHRDKEHFPDPDKFDPERFSAEGKNSRHPYAFQPFGHGPRNCIGMRFALTNAKMAIATLIHNFNFEPCMDTLIPMQFENTNFIKPKGGIKLKVTRIPQL